VDLEYAGWNYRGFDLGNHLCEYASDFQQEPPDRQHVLDFGRYPTPAQRRAFARAYLHLSGEDEAEEAAEEVEAVSALVREMDEFALASHLYWGVWGLLQARISSITGFDFAAYAKQRLEEYAKGMGDG
jgi:choline/ethanolamine kinase